MKNLKDITVVCIDCVDKDRAMSAINMCMSKFDFDCVKLFTHFDIENIPSGLQIIPIEQINNIGKYSEFVINELWKYIDTNYILIIQWDGNIWNANAWTDEFYNYDYIGAPWEWDHVVGNGGFSFRSKKLLMLSKDIPYNSNINNPNEDHHICRDIRHQLEELGCKFAPVDIAYKFSVEGEPYKGSLGWHHGLTPLGTEVPIKELDFNTISYPQRRGRRR